MVVYNTILCQTGGQIASSTQVPLTDAMTGQNATIPVGAVVTDIFIYRDGDQAVSANCTMQLGLVGTPSSYISVSDTLGTNDLNSGHLVMKRITQGKGLAAATELRLTLSNALNVGTLTFEVTYATYT